MSQPQVVECYQRFCDGSRSLGDEKGPGFNGSAFSGRNVKLNLRVMEGEVCIMTGKFCKWKCRLSPHVTYLHYAHVCIIMLMLRTV